MKTRQTTLTHYPLLPAFEAPVAMPSRATRRPRIVVAPTTIPRVREDQPAVLWRDSLNVATNRLTRWEGWAFLALAAFALPAAAISQSALWHLLDGVLDRAIRAFMLLPGS